MIRFLWPDAIIYYFSSTRSSLSIGVTKHNETGSTVAINSNRKDGDKIITYIFYHLQKHEERPETSKEEKED